MSGKQLYLFGLPEDGSKISPKSGKKLQFDLLTVIAVVFLLSLIISFSLGVEKGKRIASADLKKKTEKALEHIDLANQNPVKVSPDATNILEELEKDEQTENLETKPKYKIQVASFHKKDTAQKEAEQLENNGYPTLVAQKGKYVVIYVGEFDNKDEAKNNLELLRKKYKDCFLRSL